MLLLRITFIPILEDLIGVKQMLAIAETPLIQTGIYDMSNEDYHNGPGISRSGIMQIRRAPIYFKHKYVDGKSGEDGINHDFLFGNAFHAYILEPQEFFSRYSVVDLSGLDRRKTEDKKKYNEMIEASQGKEIIRKEDFEKIQEMASSLLSSKTARDLINGAQYEKSLFWEDEDTGILCKCRPDIFDEYAVCDLKTTADASEYSFSRSIYKYGYHIQAAMMLDGLKKVLNFNICEENSIFLAIEKEAPYCIGIYSLSTEWIQQGRREYKDALKTYKKCLLSNEWPGYGVKEISVPNYVRFL
jgi:exodeoxyribonuclease VIII